MRAALIVREWTATVQAALPRLSGFLAAGLALFSLACVTAQSCWGTVAALHACAAVKPASRRRRWERLLANPRLDPAYAEQALAALLLGSPGPGPLRLILDETSVGRDRLRCLMLSLAWRKRALPVAWRCYRRGAGGVRLPELTRQILDQAAAAVPPGREVFLLMDRGLAWPRTIRQARGLGWKVVTRLQGQTRVRPAGGAEGRADALAVRGGRTRAVPAEVFKDAGWVGGWLVTRWAVGRAEPWLLFSDGPDGRRAVRLYGCRMRVEEQFRDLKSYGLNWQRSRVRRAERMDRLLVVLALALLAMATCGVRLVKSGRRKDLTPVRRRVWSVVRLGLGWLTAWLSQTGPPPRMPAPRLHRIHLDMR
jgi:hypothetical protein